MSPFNHILVPLLEKEDFNIFMEASLLARYSNSRVVAFTTRESEGLLKMASGLVDMKVDIRKCVGDGNIINLVKEADVCMPFLDVSEGTINVHAARALAIRAPERMGWNGGKASEKRATGQKMPSEDGITLSARRPRRRRDGTFTPSSRARPPSGRDEKVTEDGRLPQSGAGKGSHVGKDANATSMAQLDCVVIGQKDLSYKGRIFRHSTVRDLVHNFPSPIIIARHFKPYRSILILIDGTPRSEAVVSYSIKIASLFNAAVTALVVGTRDPYIEKLVRYLEQVGRIYGVSVSTSYIDGNPTLAMVKKVRSDRFDLTVIKWDCETVKKDIIHRIIHDAPKSVMVIP